MRVRGFPFGAEVSEFLEGHHDLLIVEQNRDAQLRSLLAIETGTDPARMQSLTRYGGFPLSAPDVVQEVLARFPVPESALQLQTVG
jgi:2-oxoglutarate ferredoxin oxidoreductase subunit alpha